MLAYFYQQNLKEKDKTFMLDETTSKHCIQVLRMQAGDEMLLTDGKGSKRRVSIIIADRKHCTVTTLQSEEVLAREVKLALAVGFTKNNSRNEWLLEKITEMGITEIFPILSQRGEKQRLKEDRIQNILVAAMLQSQQCHLPVLHPFTSLKDLPVAAYPQKIIGHCLEEEKRKPLLQTLQKGKDTLILIGPEGDFTPAEIALCLSNGFQAVTLGRNRLRTETAGLYVSTLFNALNYG